MSEHEVIRWECPDCQQSVVAQSAAFVAHFRATHRCLPPVERKALRGEYDG